MAATEEIAGIDLAPFTAWFRTRHPSLEEPLAFSLIIGGRSNLTYLVEDAGDRRWILRRPPLGPLLPSAHDMGREYRVLAALDATPVPVPSVVDLCNDQTVIGAPFYLMRFVEGVVLRDAGAAAPLSEAARRSAAESLVDVLAALHSVDPDTVGLGDLGRRDAYVERLIGRWRKQWESSKTRDLRAVDEVALRLSRRMPAAGPVRIVHGDYGLHNVLVAPDSGTVQAVLDWELCTLGEPLADLGWLLALWTDPTDNFSPLPDPTTVLPGFPVHKDLADLYARRSSLDLADVDFYVALAYWKLAVVLQGVYARHAAGGYGATDDSWQHFNDLVPKLAEAALEATDRAGR